MTKSKFEERGREREGGRGEERGGDRDILVALLILFFLYVCALVYCVACVAWSTHRDHDSVVVVVRASHFWLPINNV